MYYLVVWIIIRSFVLLLIKTVNPTLSRACIRKDGLEVVISNRETVFGDKRCKERYYWLQPYVQGE